MTDSERLVLVISKFDKSTKAFADRIGKSPQVLYDVIDGRNGISKKMAEIIHAKCGISAGWLITGNGNPNDDEQAIKQQILLEETSTPYNSRVCLECLKKDCETHQLKELIKEKDSRITELNEIIAQQIKQWGAASSSWRVPDEKRDTG